VICFVGHVGSPEENLKKNSAHRKPRDVIIVRGASNPLLGSGFTVMWVIGNRAL
jgi:hypothetical protein